MEFYVGIDIIEIEKFLEVYKKFKEKFLKKIFTEEELKYLKGDILKMCISFSLKESIWKTLPEKIQKKMYFKEIKIGWKNPNPFLLEKLENYKLFITYNISKKYIITLALLFRN